MSIDFITVLVFRIQVDKSILRNSTTRVQGNRMYTAASKEIH